MITTTLATIALAVAPVVNFTTDSKYTKESILTFSVTEKTVTETSDELARPVSEDVTYLLNVKENYVIGYDIYDKEDTDYIDGIKIDGVFLPSDWTLPNYDPSIEHIVTVKTVYSNDIGGWFAQAKDGDFSAIMSNPIMLLQLFYYLLAAGSLIFSGVAFFKSRKHKAKTSGEIASEVALKAKDLEKIAEGKLNDVEERALAMMSDIITPALDNIRKQNETLIQATVLARSGDEESTLALLELLRKSGTEGVDETATAVKTRIKEAQAKAKEDKNNAIKTMKEAIAEISAPVETPKSDYDGTSI